MDTRRSTALTKPAVRGPATSLARSTEVVTAAWAAILVASSWWTPSLSTSRTGGSILATGRSLHMLSIAS